ncbi:MAG: hypothetical protein IPI30_21730 [Saprospiraceae bacterium]|nr:hypothetical protein [Candidatus Vicinibacter affinis]
MKNLVYLLMGLVCIISTKVTAQESENKMSNPTSVLAGYHVGVVQIMFAANKGNFTTLDKYDFYFIGFPIGITFNTASKLKFDLEFVPVVKPYFQFRSSHSSASSFSPRNFISFRKWLDIWFQIGV